MKLLLVVLAGCLHVPPKVNVAIQIKPFRCTVTRELLTVEVECGPPEED